MKATFWMTSSAMKWRYQGVGQDAWAAVSEPVPERRPRHLLLLLLSTATSVFAVAFLVVLWLYLQLIQRKAHSANVSELNCGHSIAEAKELGCLFDPLAKAWLPAACPRYGLDEFQAAALQYNQSQWRYWADQDGHRELSIKELASMAEKKWWELSVNI